MMDITYCLRNVNLHIYSKCQYISNYIILIKNMTLCVIVQQIKRKRLRKIKILKIHVAHTMSYLHDWLEYYSKIKIISTTFNNSVKYILREFQEWHWLCLAYIKLIEVMNAFVLYKICTRFRSSIVRHALRILWSNILSKQL